MELKKETTHLFSNWNFYNMSDFEMNKFHHVRFKNTIAGEKSRFDSLYSVKTTYFVFFVLFQKAWFCIKNFLKC